MRKPTCRELLAVVGQGFKLGREVSEMELAGRVERVLALHEEWDEQPVCRGCGESWPCSTVRLLDGEEP